MGLYDDSALRAAIDLRDAYDATLAHGAAVSSYQP